MSIVHELLQNWSSYRFTNYSLDWLRGCFFGRESFASRRNALLRILRVAHDERLDASQLVDNLSEEYMHGQRRRLKKLARCLDQDTPVAPALEQIRGLVSPEDVLALQFAQQTGTNDQVYASLLDDQRVSISFDDRNRAIQAMLHAFATGLVTAFTLVFISIFILPTLAKLREDFGLQENSLDQFLSVFEALSYYGFFAIAFFAFLVVVSFSSTLRPIISRQFRKWLGIADSPTAGVLRLLSISMDTGRPMPSALSTLGRYHYDSRTRQKLLLARNEVEQGSDVWQSMSDADLLAADEAQGLAALSDNKVCAWAMRSLADVKSKRVGSRESLITTILPLVVVLFLAIIVLWLGFSILQFLTELMG